MAIERSSGGVNPTPVESGVQKKLGYLQEVQLELKKTTWPSRQEATRLTAVVIGVIVALGVYMGILDKVLNIVMTKFSLIK